MKRALFLVILSSSSMCTARAPNPHRVAEADASSVSSEGRFLAYTGLTGAYDDVFLLDLQTGERRSLTNADSEGEAGNGAVISRDGQQVVYPWINYKDGLGELHTVGLNGSTDRIFYQQKNVQVLNLKDWSADGEYVLVAIATDTSSQYLVVSVRDGSVRVLKTFESVIGPEIMQAVRFSPDGRFIAYDVSEPDRRNRDIFVLSFDGSREVPLVKHPAIDRLLGWTPDGDGILFSSDRNGTVDVWLIEVADGEPRGIPTVVKAGLGRATGLNFTRNGAFYYSRQVWTSDVYLTALDSAKRTLQPARQLIHNVSFDSSVDWSPDGRDLAFVSGAGLLTDLEDPFVLGVYSFETGTTRHRQLSLNRQHAFQPSWSPDGRSLFVQGLLNSRQGLYRIDAQTGAVVPMVQAEPGCWLCIEWPVWPRDGTVIFWRRSLTAACCIVARDLASGRETELYRTVSAAHLALSPDGEQLAFIWLDSVTGQIALKVMPRSGGEPREILRLPAPQLLGYGQPLFALEWEPDSRHIIYAPTAAGQRKVELWRISIDGGAPRSLGLVMEGLLPYGLSVHPDGRRIAFTAGTEPREEVWVLKDFLPARKTAK